MKLRTTLILLAIAVGLFAFIRFYERKLPTTKEAEEGKYLVTLDRDKVDTIRIESEGETILLERDGLNWKMSKPLEDYADSSAMARLFTSLELLKPKAVIEAREIEEHKSRLKEYGLANSTTKLTLKGGEKTVGIRFGSALPVEGTGYYVQIEDDPNVYVLTGDLKEQVQAKPDAFRDPRLARLTVAEVEKVEIRTQAGAIEAVKDGGDWNLVRPLKARGDSQRIQDVVARIVNAQITEFAKSDAANVARYGLGEPRGTVTLTAQDRSEPVVVTIGKPVADSDQGTKGANVYVTVSGRDAVFKVPPGIGDILDTRPNDIRDRNLVRLNPDIVDRFTISTPGSAPLVLARKGEEWMVMGDENTPANSAKAEAMLERIRNERVEGFVSDVASELASYGLEKPRVSVTFSSYASENTAESKAGENEIVTVQFGRSEGGKVFARVKDEPFIVSLDESVLDDIGTERAEWKTLKVFDRNPQEIETLNIQGEGRQPVSMTREEGTWKSGDGAVDPVNTRSLLNTLAGLRAVRWVRDSDATGFKKPSLTIEFDDTKLVVGGESDEELWFGRVEGEEGTFLISKPDYEALALDVLIPPVDEPPATPAASPESPALPAE